MEPEKASISRKRSIQRQYKASREHRNPKAIVINIRHAVLRIFEQLYKIFEQLFGIFLSIFLDFSEQNLESLMIT